MQIYLIFFLEGHYLLDTQYIHIFDRNKLLRLSFLSFIWSFNQLTYLYLMNWDIMSMGTGKMMVEFFSALMLFSVFHNKKSYFCTSFWSRSIGRGKITVELCSALIEFRV